MSWIDQASLVVHVLAAAGLIGGGIVQVLAGIRLRSASTADGIALWAGFARSAGPVLIGSAIFSLLTGGHLAGGVWTTEAASGFSHPFISLGAAALVLLAPVGPMMGGRQLRRLSVDADSGLPVEGLARRAGSAAVWGPVHSLIGVAVGLVWVMSVKPDSWLATALILLGCFAAGWGSGLLVVRRSGG